MILADLRHESSLSSVQDHATYNCDPSVHQSSLVAIELLAIGSLLLANCQVKVTSSRTYNYHYNSRPNDPMAANGSMTQNTVKTPIMISSMTDSIQ